MIGSGSIDSLFTDTSNGRLQVTGSWRRREITLRALYAQSLVRWGNNTRRTISALTAGWCAGEGRNWCSRQLLTTHHPSKHMQPHQPPASHWLGFTVAGAKLAYCTMRWTVLCFPFWASLTSSLNVRPTVTRTYHMGETRRSLSSPLIEERHRLSSPLAYATLPWPTMEWLMRRLVVRAVLPVQRAY